MSEQAMAATHEKRVLIVDDEEVIRTLLSSFFSELGFVSLAASSAEEGLAVLDRTPVDIALVDIRLSGMNGLQMLSEIKRLSPQTEVVIITSHASLETGTEAIRRGAYDYLIKPFDDLDSICLTIQRAIEKRELTLRNERLLRDLERQNEELSRAVSRLTSLINAGRAMSSMFTLQELLDFFVQLVSDQLMSDRVSLMLVDEEKNELQIVASRGISPEVVQSARVKVGDGIAGYVASAGQPLLVNDLHSGFKFKDVADPSLSDSFISMPIVLSIPIKLQEKILGVINVTNKRTDGEFDSEDMAFLGGLAGQAAVTIENARHFRELQAAYECLRESQAQLVVSERLNALGEMAAGVAHDLNNVLGGVLGKAQLLLYRLEHGECVSDAMKEDLRIIERCALQGAETIRRIQSFTRIRHDLPGDVLDLNEAVQDALELTQHKWKNEQEARGNAINVHTELSAVSPIRGAIRELVQAISNLIFNAVEAMPAGGALKLRTFQQNDSVVLEVSDTGGGMSDDVRRKIFEPFFTTKEYGNGLGLSVTYGIIARHNGEISVGGNGTQGTTFRVKLPAQVQDQEHQSTANDSECPSSRPLNVMVVEDDVVMQVVIGESLIALGHEVTLASSGEEALSLFKPAAFDLVITDLCMKSMSGLDLAAKVRSIEPRVRVVLCSGWALQQRNEEMRDAGIDVVIQKPIVLADLDRAIQKALESSHDGEASYYFSS